MKVEITSRMAVKPNSPTPSHPGEFKLSLLDQLTPNFYGLIVFFYEPNIRDGSNIATEISQRSLRLQSSLSEILTRLYPMAGRLNGAASVDCNDEGAYFIEARVDCDLSDFLAQPDTNVLNQFLPTTDPKLAELASNCIVLIQFTAFRCGGTAISVCNSHKIADAASLVTLLKYWTSAAGESTNEFAAVPEFIGASLMPPNDRLPNMVPANVPSGKWITKRFVFEGSAIARLRAKIVASLKLRDPNHHYPSRVETVLALIWKCACSVSKSKTESESSKKSALFQAVNLRARMVPPLPETSIGNLIWPVPVILEENDAELHDMVYKMREAITDFCNDKVHGFKGEKSFFVVTESLQERREKLKDVESYRCTSWCKFPLYETDFGWGKPTWVSSAGLAFKNTIVLLDTKKGDGIEAWVTLEEEEMAEFERDDKLLEYASFNPSVNCVTLYK